MQYAHITGWGKSVPPATLTNDDLATFMETTDEWIKTRTGISKRNISHVNTSEMASVAAKHALAAAGIDGSELDLIILATASPDTLIPNIASTVQANIGATCGAFDINAACLSNKVLDNCGISIDDVDFVIPHQANERIIDTLVSRMKIPKEKAFVNIADYGNTSAATIPIAICDALSQGRIEANQTILSCAFGAGLTSAALLLKWGERTTPINTSDAALPPCDKTALELIKPAVDYFFNKAKNAE